MDEMHKGHRQRTKARFAEHGLDNFNDVNVLELLLMYALPRRDTNALAHALLERFGSLSGVLEASYAELKKTPGLGESASVLLMLIPAVSRRYLINKTPEGEMIDSPTKAGRYLIPFFTYERCEVVLVLLLDARRRVLCCQEVSRGVVNAAEINTRRIATLALERNASYVILSHNHLSGNPTPSMEDERSTRALRDALAVVGVELSDHIVVAGCDYVSLQECGLF